MNACLVFLFVLFSFCKISGQEQNNSPLPINEQPIVINTNLITFNVSVTNPNGLAVSGLSKENFTVLENKIPQEINFFSNEDAPASISIVLDTSGSMSGKKIDLAKQALADFIQTSKEQDEFFLIDVGSKASLLLDRTRDSEAILQKFNFVEPKGNTALFDAIELGIERVTKGTHYKKIVLIISDGEDNNSRLSFRKLKNLLKESNATIYAVGIDSNLNSQTKGLSGRAALSELATVSGGKSYFPDNSEQLADVFDKISLEIRHLYSIGYYPADFAADGKVRHVSVKVKTSDESTRLIVHSKKEYRAEPINIDR
ncbi:MAG: VWA domain-containing protein [Pyrinomonadaceae bacterium]|nr:VWA domain-containing protein [Pyrinomonadaceae bacterium]